MHSLFFPHNQKAPLLQDFSKLQALLIKSGLKNSERNYEHVQNRAFYYPPFLSNSNELSFSQQNIYLIITEKFDLQVVEFLYIPN